MFPSYEEVKAQNEERLQRSLQKYELKKAMAPVEIASQASVVELVFAEQCEHAEQIGA